MFNLGANPKVRGSGHLILNGLRALTIIGLGTAMVASWAMIVMSGLTKHFEFFDSMSHFVKFAVAVFLVISEVGLFSKYFANNWPVLSPTHSLAFLGLAQFVIGIAIMGDLTKPAYLIDNLGQPLWRLVIASGILNITFGAFNIIASTIFRDGKNHITARQIRSDGSLAAPPFKDNDYDASYAYSQRSGSFRQQHKEVVDDAEPPSFAKRLTRMVPKNMNLNNFRKSKIQISKPMPMGFGSSDVERGFPNDRASPILPDVQRPPSALHPSNTGSSRYSEAHMSRFPVERYPTEKF
jgi:hypothetical protein